ncbi:Beta-1,3-galactosyltransferase 2 [Globodera pallida]|nr:Beta-1,3-galactosyltransferase 2 [Globodera pallida]
MSFKSKKISGFEFRAHFSLEPTSNENDLSDECCGENMVYSVTLNDSRIIRGKKFKCSNKWLLERYKLSDKYALNKTITVKSPGDPKFVFLTAVDDKYYPSFRMLIANIKEKFGCKQHIIAYDRGTVTKNKEWMNEINSICNLEWRIFDFTQMVEGRVRDLESRAWKIFVIAHVFAEFDTVVWLDNSIFFESSNLSKLLAPIQSQKIGDVQLPSFSGHGMNRATHPEMYDFLPMYTNYGANQTFDLTGNNDPPQFESDFVIVHKSEESRQLLKWALLCAAESDCIVPIGQTRACIYTKKAPKLKCHRVDGSLFGILRYNMEYRREIEDPSFLPQISRAHPRSTQKQLKSNGMDGLFKLYRRQTFRGSNADWLHKVQYGVVNANDVTNGFENRKGIRQTWMNDSVPGEVIRFLIADAGKGEAIDVQQKLEEEQAKHGDLVFLHGFVDIYAHIHLILILVYGGFKWQQSFCANAEWVLKVDDDALVHLRRLAHWTGKKFRPIVVQNPLVYFGYIYHQSIPVRDPKSKWYAPKEMYPNDVYPDFMSGTVYLTNPATINAILLHTRQIDGFYLEDVFYTGILAKLANLDILLFHRRQHVQAQHPKSSVLSQKSAIPKLFAELFLKIGLIVDERFKLTDGQNGVKSIPIPYRATDQCMPKMDAKHGKTTYGLSFRLHSKGGHCDGGLLICYPGMLNRHADSLDFKVKGLFQIDNKKDNKVNQYCSSKMQKEGISAGQIHWRGIKVYTMPNGTQNHETMLEAYKLGTNVTQFFIHLGGNGTDLLTMITVNDGKPFIDNESNLQKQFREQFWNGAFLREHTGLWMLGLDVLPSMEQQNVKLFIARDCNCTMEAWMLYTVTMNDSRIIRGKRSFNCSNNWLLERYKLSDKYALNKTIKARRTVKSPGDPKFVFLTAADDKYYPSFRMLVANIKEKFGCKQHIIAYDLGKVTKNKEWMNEINSICNLEWRIFNFTQMADDRVRDLKSYAWKIFVIAKVFSEFDTFVWLDTSIFFESDNLAKLLMPIQTGKIGSVQVPSYTGHGMNLATHPGKSIN